LLALPDGVCVGHFIAISLGNDVTVDVMEADDHGSTHLAFLVDDGVDRASCCGFGMAFSRSNKGVTQLVQRGKCELHLGLDPCRAHHPATRVGCPLGHVFQ
jgi:hypothetical protein